ncbi:MAG: ABC transporter ATP-binding protein [Burkholderiales bacterium]|nr:ABC transporter ATP-binding protein [Burkholderiales bacterium]
MAVEVQHVSVRYPGASRVALDDVSFKLESGDIGVLIGPSGCGKTTLLRAIAGLEPVIGGVIAIQGRAVSGGSAHVPPESRRVGMVFQDYALFPHLSVAANVAFGLHQWDATARRQRVGDVLDLVDLSHVANRFPHALSGGQQQRVALARALAPKPELLLLDEPFSNLDVNLRGHLAQEVRAILKRARATALLVTHDQLEAFAVGDYIGVLFDGHLHQWATPYTLYHRPATREVASFVGHGVFAPARVETRDSDAGAPGVAVSTPVGEYTERGGDPDATHTLPTPGTYDVLLRADDVVHDDASPVKAEIINKVFRGSEFLYSLRLHSGETVLAHVPSHHDHSVGEWIGIRAELDHVVLFDRKPDDTR